MKKKEKERKTSSKQAHSRLLEGLRWRGAEQSGTSCSSLTIMKFKQNICKARARESRKAIILVLTAKEQRQRPANCRSALATHAYTQKLTSRRHAKSDERALFAHLTRLRGRMFPNKCESESSTACCASCFKN
jgi:hypothetical protein